MDRQPFDGDTGFVQLVEQAPERVDGTVGRDLQDELDDASIDVEHLSIHAPDLDDVFFAVTGHAAAESTIRQEEEVFQS